MGIVSFMPPPTPQKKVATWYEKDSELAIQGGIFLHSQRTQAISSGMLGNLLYFSVCWSVTWG